MLKPEAELQESVFDWLAYYNRAAYESMYAIPNGGSRNKLEAANLKRQGVKAGVPDICLAMPNKVYHGLYIELKWDYNKPSDKQSEWLERLTRNGYKTAVCYTIDEVIKAITDYLKER